MSYPDEVFSSLEKSIKHMIDNGSKDDLIEIRAMLLSLADYANDEMEQLCDYCNGEGEIDISVEKNGIEVDGIILCKYCDGTGKNGS